MRTANSLALCLIPALATSCGTSSDSGEHEEAPFAALLLVAPDGNLCPSFADPSSALDLFADALATGEPKIVGIAEARVVEECSGAGGTHVFSTRTTDGKRFWLGEHACSLAPQEHELNGGVIVGLGGQTAALFQGTEGWCMNYPGEDEVFATDITTQAMAWFESNDEAQRFIDAAQASASR